MAELLKFLTIPVNLNQGMTEDYKFAASDVLQD